MVSSVIGPDGTMTHTTRGAASASAKRRQSRDVGDLRTRVVPDDLMSAFAQALPHVEAHLAETDQTQLHVVPLSSRWPVSPGSRTGISR